jgi:hypothetical protein
MLTKNVKISAEASSAIQQMVWKENGTLGILPPKLDRKLYVEVNKVLVNFGGKWNKTKKGHVFDENSLAALKETTGSGVYVVEKDGFFETPAAVVDRMMAVLPPPANGLILEPSAGEGAIVNRIVEKFPKSFSQWFVIEKNADRRKKLHRNLYICDCEDFLEFVDLKIPTIKACENLGITPVLFAACYMNPPFEDGQDMAHVMGAYKLLKPGGSLCAIMSEGTFFRKDKKAKQFQDWFYNLEGWSEKLPEGSFKESGTGVSTRIVLIKKYLRPVAISG